MNPLSPRTYLLIFLALVVPAGLSLWLMAVPTLMTFSSFIAITTLIMGVAAVTLNSAQNAQPTGSLGQLLYETERHGSHDVFQRRR